MKDHMQLALVADYVEKKTGVRRSRATIYNWVTKGVKVDEDRIKLETVSYAGQAWTKEAWVDAFLAKLDRRS